MPRWRLCAFVGSALLGVDESTEGAKGPAVQTEVYADWRAAVSCSDLMSGMWAAQLAAPPTGGPSGSEAPKLTSRAAAMARATNNGGSLHCVNPGAAMFPSGLHFHQILFHARRDPDGEWPG